MPGSFLIFEQELVEFAKQQVKRDILNLAECFQVGVKLKMKPKVVEAALIFFHRQITFLYFRHVLPNVVFLKPQLPLDVIKSIVDFSYKVSSGKVMGIKPELSESLRDGIITEEILSHNLSLNFIPNPTSRNRPDVPQLHTSSIEPRASAQDREWSSHPAKSLHSHQEREERVSDDEPPSCHSRQGYPPVYPCSLRDCPAGGEVQQGLRPPQLLQ